MYLLLIVKKILKFFTMYNFSLKRLRQMTKIEPHFMKHPEAVETLKSAFSEMIRESDRGAVLIGAELVHTALTNLFLKMTPADLSNKKTKKLLKYPSALSTFGAKADMAILSRYIPLDIHHSMTALRSLRNEAAHSSINFRLTDEEIELQKICDLGVNVESTLNQLAAKLLFDTAIGDIWESQEASGAEESNKVFDSPDHVWVELKKRPELIKNLKTNLPRFRLASAVALICGLIVFFREKGYAVLGSNGIVASIHVNDNES
jgi:hypothetical protein